MKLINRLIIEAKTMRNNKEIIHAIVERVDDEWSAKAYLWDGVQGHTPTVERTTHATTDAAIDYLQELAGKYPNSRDVPIIMDDLPG